jgi:hypothetical protein
VASLSGSCLFVQRTTREPLIVGRLVAKRGRLRSMAPRSPPVHEQHPQIPVRGSYISSQR